ncbi:hypothetical protein FJY63_08335, partial [Candidatus Sumerlaeota bacterium]|nr:hypothetical protein [Candidatus Sumerlaeota bacterium]
MKARMLSPVFSCLIVAWPLGRAARCQQMDNFTLLSHLKEADYTAFAVSGNTIFVVQGTDLIALDATDAARPAQLSRRQLNGAATADLVLTNGQYLFARTNTLGLQIYNVSNPRSVSYVGRFAPYDTYQPEVIALDGNRLYFGSSQVLRIFDVTNPSSPNQLANLTYPSRQMSVSQGRAMLSGSTTQPLRVYDLRDPAHPAHLGDLDFRLPYPPNISRTIYHHDTIEMNWPYLISGDTVMYYYWDKFDHWVFYTKYGIHLFTPGTSNSWSRFEYLYDRFYYAGNVFETWDYPITIPPNPLPGFFSDFALTSDKVFANRRYMGD